MADVADIEDEADSNLRELAYSQVLLEERVHRLRERLATSSGAGGARILRGRRSSRSWTGLRLRARRWFSTGSRARARGGQGGGSVVYCTWLSSKHCRTLEKQQSLSRVTSCGAEVRG